MTPLQFIDQHLFMCFFLTVFTVYITGAVLMSFATALGKCGTKHCGSCACHQETGDGDDDGAPPVKSTRKVLKG